MDVTVDAGGLSFLSLSSAAAAMAAVHHSATTTTVAAATAVAAKLKATKCPYSIKE